MKPCRWPTFMWAQAFFVVAFCLLGFFLNTLAHRHAHTFLFSYCGRLTPVLNIFLLLFTVNWWFKRFLLSIKYCSKCDLNKIHVKSSRKNLHLQCEHANMKAAKIIPPSSPFHCRTDCWGWVWSESLEVSEPDLQRKLLSTEVKNCS